LAQHDFAIDNAPGLTVRTDINAALAAIQSSSSGPVEPVVKAPGQAWFDTSTPAVMRLAVRDQANATWVNVAFDAVGAGYVSKAGDTMTGGLKITKPYNAAGDEALTIAPSGGTLGNAILVLNKPTATGANVVHGRTNNVLRWYMQLGDGTAESGSNAGSNFAISRCNDAGAGIDSPLSINRANGAATFSFNVTAGGILASKMAGNPACYMQNAAAATLGLVYYNAADSTMRLQQQSSGGSIWIDSSGNFIISGNGFKSGGGSWGATSDARIKTVQGDYSQGLDDILALRPVVYSYKGNDTPTADQAGPALDHGDGEIKSETSETAPYPASPHYQAAKDQTAFVGLIAQEVEAIFPDMVTHRAGYIDGEPATDLRELDTSPLIYALVNAVKTLSARIEALEAAAGA
jgi:hypothetical protein